MSRYTDWTSGEPIEKEWAMTGPTDPALRARLRKELTAWGLDVLTADPPHSWRCDYYKDIDPAKGGGPCDCVDRLVNDLVAALRSPDTETAGEAG